MLGLTFEPSIKPAKKLWFDFVETSPVIIKSNSETRKQSAFEANRESLRKIGRPATSAEIGRGRGMSHCDRRILDKDDALFSEMIWIEKTGRFALHYWFKD